MSEPNSTWRSTDDLVGELLHRFARLERRLGETETQVRGLQRKVIEVRKSREKWKAECRNLRFQLAQKRPTR